MANVGSGHEMVLLSFATMVQRLFLLTLANKHEENTQRKEGTSI